MNFREEIEGFLKAPENFRVALEVERAIPAVKRRIAWEYWDGLQEKLEEFLAPQAALQKKWKLETEGNRSSDWNALSLVFSASQSPANLRFRLSAEEGEHSLTMGVFWSKPQRNEEPGYESIQQLRLDIKEKGFGLSYAAWWVGWKELGLKLRDPETLYRISAKEIVGETPAQEFWEFFMEFQKRVGEINLEIEKDPTLLKMA